ncbi:hypothetical protein DF3PB_6130002 [uncultured Defluviicoccus sp.]|uniref:Uncharacterized protein n=1 Tax=metagenome TaxID=256318 RepID=A0A380TKN7_9ZZZZ|nr:hypothetical protein DF3PB_6130002 [uncultured Defluviicoccus sp.]
MTGLQPSPCAAIYGFEVWQVTAFGPVILTGKAPGGRVIDDGTDRQEPGSPRKRASPPERGARSAIAYL